MGCMRGATNMRLLSICLLVVLQTMVAWGNNEFPYRWQIDRQSNAQLHRLGNGWLQFRSLPAWQSADPVLAITDGNGQVLHHALDGADIRTVTVWRNHVLALQVDNGTNVVLVLDSLLRVQRRLALPLPLGITPDSSSRFYSRSDRSSIFLLCTGVLFVCNLSSVQPRFEVVEQRVFGVGLGSGPWILAFVHDVGGIAYASMLDTLLHRRIAPSVPLATRAKIGLVAGKLVVVSPVEGAVATQVSVITPTSGAVQTSTVSVPDNLVTWVAADTTLLLAAVDVSSGTGKLIVDQTENGFGITQIEAGRYALPIPPQLGAALNVWSASDTIVVWCSGGMATVVHGKITSQDVTQSSLQGYTDFTKQNGTIVASGKQGTVLLRRVSQPWWWLWWVVTVAGPLVVPAVLILAIVGLSLYINQQRRYLRAMQEVPGAGLVLLFDATGRLIKTNERAASLLRITPKVPMRRLFRAYMRHRGVENLLSFVAMAFEERRAVSNKVSISDDDDVREYMFTAQPLWGAFGRFNALMVTGIDITEALERRRLVNWAQLAHDMQTNLSTIRLNAEQVSANTSSRDTERVRRILFQTDVLIQRVRDLVSVGRSEDLQRTTVHSAEFCTQIRHEFDPEMFPHVHFVMKLRGTPVSIDRLKLSRGIRNAVENAIKSLRGSQGTVEIATWFDKTNVYFRITDTGVGMDTLTLENMMKPYFTTAKDGTGTGIGTMIMQHVTHLHGGSLRVTSEPGQGTQVVFRIPFDATQQPQPSSA